MTLRAVRLSEPEFQEVCHHLTTHRPHYRNMHLRDFRQRNRQRGLRYLHAMRAVEIEHSTGIEGMISGPDGLLVHYRIQLRNSGPRIQVFREDGPQAEIDRIGARFLPQIMKRIQEERAGNEHNPKRLKGQFYLRRCRPGMRPDHRTCVAAVAARVLDPWFVGQLGAWNFELLWPQ
jgi:hypothetical protein